MPYRFATKKRDYSDFASGRVFTNSPGRTAFPVRLSDEILQRCWARRAEMGLTEPMTLYVPCCGGAYHLSVLAFLHRGWIKTIVASDVDSEAVSLAKHNLALTSRAGLAERHQALVQLEAQFGKASHRAAIASVDRLVEQTQITPELNTLAFVANGLDFDQLQAGLAGTKVDVVFSDIPYGLQSDWVVDGVELRGHSTPLWHLLDGLRGVISAETIVAISSSKKQKAAHEAYQRLDRFNLGKRRITLLQLTD